MKINWDEKVCQHAGVCVKSLPDVFKIVDGNFVIDPASATYTDVKGVVAACPSDALSVDNSN